MSGKRNLIKPCCCIFQQQGGEKCKVRGEKGFANQRRRLRWAACAAGIWLTLLVGCGQQGGAWLYTFGLYPTQKIPTEFTFPKGSVLVLVDDDRELIQPSTAREVLVDEMAKRLKEHEISDNVTTNEEIARIRQAEPDFDKRGARELGRLANADTVLWLSTIDFSLNNDLEMLVNPGRFAVMVKAINAKAEKPEDVRLWPPDREGRLVEVSVSPHDLRACHNLKEAHEKMASALADEVAKLFYQQEVR